MSIPVYIRSALIHMCDEVSSPTAQKIKQLVQADRWDELVQLKVHPHSYSNAHDYHQDVIVVDFLRKCEDLPTTVDRKAAALDNFWKSEKECYVANRRLDPFLLSYNLTEEFGLIGEVICHMRKNLAEILGPCPDTIDGRFGPGATYGDKGKWTTLPHKMSSYPTFTSDAVWFLPQWSSTKWGRITAEDDRQVDCVRGNRYSSVPKDCLKDRGICIEPSINLFYQLGLGRALKKRLATRGLNLEIAQGIHRQVACDASKTGNFATIDLSNASDTICKNLVRLLLPHDWFVQLDDLRSKMTYVNGRWVLLEKFSSMGNGFTFELETAIFLAICQGAAFLHGISLTPHKDVWVYGDDIIVPSSVASTVLSLLRYFGLTPNENKTFLEGSFRESCGGDFFNGTAVRPYHLKKLPNEPQEYIAIANGIRRLGLNNPDSDLHSGFLLRAWFRILDAIPSNIRRCRGPAHLGDLVIHDNESVWSFRLRSGIRYFRVYRPSSYRMIRWDRFSPNAILACALYGTSTYIPPQWKYDTREGSQPGGVIPRKGVRGYKLGWAPYS